MIIGQNKIINEINSINSLQDLPKSLLIVGSFGSGKHSIFNYICNKFNIEVEHIDYELSLDILNEMYSLSIPKMYLIDFNALKENKHIERFQNTLLKFLEEPPEFAWITIISYSSNSILPTILNRCQKLVLQPYSIDDLRAISIKYNKSFTDDDLFILRTPYNIINTSDNDLQEIKKLSTNIIENMSKANLSNILTIKNKLDTDLKLFIFINIFSEYLYTAYIDSFNQKYFDSLLLTNKLNENLYVLGINKSNLIDNYLVNLKTLLND